MSVTPSSLWNSISLRTKITGVTVLMLTFGLIVTGIGTMTVLRSYMLQQIDSQLRTAYTDISAFLGPDASPLVFKSDDVLSAPKEYYVGLLDSDGQLTAENWDSQLEVENPNIHELPVSPSPELEAQQPVYTIPAVDRQPEWHAVVRTIRYQNDSYGTVIIAESLTKTDSVTTTYLSIFLAFGVGVVVLGAMLTRLLVTSTFTPLREVERTAAAIADGDFSQRMAGDTPNTEVGRLNRSLNTMLSRIDRAFSDRARTIEQMRQFVGDASHELRTPLVSVRGYAELYRMGALQTPEEVAAAMDRIEREAVRMGTLVEDLLELARLDETKPLNFSRIDLVPIVVDAAFDARASSPERIVSIILPRSSQPVTFAPAVDAVTHLPPAQADEKSVPTITGAINFAGSTLARLRSRKPRSVTNAEEVSADVATPALGVDEREDIEPIVLADENKIRQVVANLIGNALRFTPPQSPIEVSVQVDEERQLAMLDIIDHGEGIPLQIREKIFQRFWRADTSRTRETGGSGLGLAIVSSIVTAHKGTVEAIETEGGGATFRVTLPLAPAFPHSLK